MLHAQPGPCVPQSQVVQAHKLVVPTQGSVARDALPHPPHFRVPSTWVPFTAGVSRHPYSCSCSALLSALVCRQRRQARRQVAGKLVRSLLLAAAVVGYVKGRRWLAVDDLVRIFRKVCAPPSPPCSWRMDAGAHRLKLVGLPQQQSWVFRWRIPSPLPPLS